jgi:hypothetical protein
MLHSTRVSVRIVATLALLSCAQSPESDDEKRSTAKDSEMPAPAGAVGAAPGNSASTLSPMQGEVVLTASVDTTQRNRPVVTGTTNLPDGSELAVMIHSRAEGTYQDRSVVRAGRYTAGPFGPLPNGTYSVDVSLSSFVQPPHVQAVIGNKGEHLRGPLVSRDELLTRVETKLSLTIGDPKAARARGDSAEQNARSLYREITTLVALGRGMAVLRNTDDLNKLSRCGREMRANVARAEKALEVARILPSRRGNLLSVAAMEVRGCVTCANDAIQWCAQAEGTLREERSTWAR